MTGPGKKREPRAEAHAHGEASEAGEETSCWPQVQDRGGPLDRGRTPLWTPAGPRLSEWALLLLCGPQPMETCRGGPKPCNGP